MSAVFEEDPDVVLLIHCRPQDEGGDMLEEVARLPREQWGRVKFTNAHDTWQGLPTDELVVLMNAADLYVSTTSGEGFGLTLVESLACQVPVVSTGWAAEVEVVGPGGILVPPLHVEYGDVVTLHSTYGMDWAVYQLDLEYPEYKHTVQSIVWSQKGKVCSLLTPKNLRIRRSRRVPL